MGAIGRSIMPVALVAALALAGSASAGTRDAPEIEDGEGDTLPTPFAGADVLGVWFTEANFTVLVTLEIADLREPVPSSRFIVAWNEQDSRRAVTVDVDEQGHMHARYGLENGTQSFGRGEVEVDYSADAPGLVTVQVPRRVMLANGGQALTDLAASARAPHFDEGLLAGHGWQDDARSDAVFVLERSYEPVYGSPPVPLAASTLALAAVAGALRRRA